MVYILFLLLCFAASFSTIHVDYIFPITSGEKYDDMAKNGLMAFYELFPSSGNQLFTNGRKYKKPFCSYVGKLIKNITTETPKGYIFVIEPEGNVNICYSSWKSSDRLFLAQPIEQSTNFVIAYLNGTKLFNGTWMDMETPEPKDHYRGNISDTEYVVKVETVQEGGSRGHFTVIPVGAIIACIYYCCKRGKDEEETAGPTTETEMKV